MVARRAKAGISGGNRYGFYQSLNNTLRHFFPEEFSGGESAVGGIAEDLGLKKIARANELDRLKRAELDKQIKELESKLNAELMPKAVTSQILDMYERFDELCFDLAELGSESLESIERMNTFKFYRFKNLLSKKLKKNVGN